MRVTNRQRVAITENNSETKLSDEELYLRFLDGDADAAEELIALHGQGLILFIYGIVKDMFYAEELMIEAFARMMVKGGKFRGESSLKTWLYAIGRNLALSHLKKHRHEKHVSLDAIYDTGGTGTSQSSEALYLLEEEKLSLYEAMQTLKYEHREAVHLVYFENMSYEDAGKVLGKTRKQIDSLVSYAKAKLKSRLEMERGT